MNLATTEVLKTIYLTASVERNRVTKLLGELAKVALLGEGLELPELPELPARGEHNGPLTSTERSRSRRALLRKERDEQARIDAVSAEPSAQGEGKPPDATHATLDATHATGVQRDVQRVDATLDATPMQRVASPPLPPSRSESPGSPHSYNSGGQRGDSDPPAREPEPATHATLDATSDATMQRVAVAPDALPLHVPYETEQAIGHSFAKAKAELTGAPSVPIQGNQLAVLVRAVLAATDDRDKDTLVAFTHQATLEFVAEARRAGVSPNALKFQDWISDNRTFPERRSGVHKAHGVQPPAKKRLWQIGNGS